MAGSVGAAQAAPVPLPYCRAPRSVAAAAVVPPPQRPLLNPLQLARFVDPLPLPPAAQPVATRASPDNPGQMLPVYRLEQRAFEAPLHRDLKPARLWGYNGSVPGPAIQVQSGQGVFVEWVNALPVHHLLPVDRRLHGADGENPEVRTVAHVHGSKVPPESDGYPERWISPGSAAMLYYPNGQDAATLWYHDHAMGITRLNIYAGLFGPWIVNDAVEKGLGLPSGSYDIPLMICDRLVDADGQLVYPISAKPGQVWVPEVNGNVILCNGRIRPYIDVEPRRYRLRLINAANARFFSLGLSGDQAMQLIASDSGLLDAPVSMKSIELFPGERAEVVVDFSACAGRSLQLQNAADDILQFRVQDRKVEDPSTVPSRLRPVARLKPASARWDRLLTLGEMDDDSGYSTCMLLNGARWSDPVTEKPELDTIETWSFVNLTGDVHPIHLHLVRFQLVDRRPFDLFTYNLHRRVVYTGPAIPPAPHEAGWKDTIRAEPGMVTRIIIRFEGYAGRYVWHCHLLEHEDNEMMRPFEVLPHTRHA